MKKTFTFFLIIVAIVIFLAGLFIAMDQFFGINNTDNILNIFKEELNIKDPEEEVDDRPIELEANTTTTEVYEGTSAFSIKSNKEIVLEQSNRQTLTFAEEKDGSFYYVLEITNLGSGPNTVTARFKDEAGNQQDLKFNIERVAYALPFGAQAVENWPNTQYIVDGENLIAPISKSRKLLNTYEATDLVDLNKEYFLYTNVEGIMLNRVAADYLKLMLTDMQAQIGKNVVIASGYRSYANQIQTYAGWQRKLGQEEADKISARPGYSEHQLGTAIDLFSEDSGLDFTAEFDNSAAGKWLQANAYKYGFIQTYPKDSEAKTGYSYEAWHWRFIGKENAEEQKQSGLIFTDWVKQKLNLQDIVPEVETVEPEQPGNLIQN